MAITSTSAKISVRMISFTPERMLSVESTIVVQLTPSGNRSDNRPMAAFTRLPTSTALLPGS